MDLPFHLGLAVDSLESEANFFENVLGAKVIDRDYENGINLDAFGCQLFLYQNKGADREVTSFHFGFNFKLSEFEALSEKILKENRSFITMEPKKYGTGTKDERTKMYVKSPTGYTVELKGYP